MMVARELAGIKGVWWREFKVFWREKSRIVASIISPIMWLFLFGSGVGARYSVDGMAYRDFIYPGILSMTVIFGSVFFGLYIVWDRKIDVFKAVLVAPVSRTSIFIGKVLGGCTDVLLQVSVLFVFSFLFPSVNPRGIPFAFLFLFLGAIALVSLGLAIGALLKSLEGFQLISALVVFPLFFSSGALFPVDTNLPSWLKVAVSVNPLSYAVDGVRGALMGIHTHPLTLDLAVLSAFAIIMVLTGSVLFSRMKL
ncbi:MAG TPA: ABC transporter permease [Syntrophales bacterium]|nr:ABC transporter permease [Syntrophales bacterium]HOL58842.1 ABC transporter permease [Syntrophales bacterium]HPO35169.1 ABC transporter permease [Syntrophales bacterium]